MDSPNVYAKMTTTAINNDKQYSAIAFAILAVASAILIVHNHTGRVFREDATNGR